MVPGMLPFAGMSLHVLLALFVRWPSATPRHGGFSKAQHKSACDKVLRALLASIVCDGQAYSLPADPDAKWNIPWPRPPVHGSKTVLLGVSAEGNVDMREGLGRVVDHHPAPSHMWWHGAKLSKFADNWESDDIARLLKASFVDKNMIVFFKQFVWLLRQRLQDLCLQSLFGKTAPSQF